MQRSCSTTKFGCERGRQNVLTSGEVLHLHCVCRRSANCDVRELHRHLLSQIWWGLYRWLIHVWTDWAPFNGCKPPHNPPIFITPTVMHALVRKIKPEVTHAYEIKMEITWVVLGSRATQLCPTWLQKLIVHFALCCKQTSQVSVFGNGITVTD